MATVNRRQPSPWRPQAVPAAVASPDPLAGALAALGAAIEGVDREQMPSLIGELARLDAAARLRLATEQRPAIEDLGLMTVEEASETLKTTTDWLYRHASKLPFTVRLAPGQLRFSRAGIRDFISKGGV